MVYIFLSELKWHVMAVVVALATFVFCLVGIIGNALSLKTIWTSTLGRRSLFVVLYIFTLTVDTFILIVTVTQEIYQLACNCYSNELFFVTVVLGNMTLTAAACLAVERFDSLKSGSRGNCNSTFHKCLLVCLVILVSCVITPWAPLVNTSESDARDGLYSVLPMFMLIFIAGIVWSLTKHIISLENRVQDIATRGQDEMSVNNSRENMSCSKAIRLVILEEVVTQALIAPVVITKLLQTNQSYQQISQTWWISLLKVISTAAKPFILLVVSRQFRKRYFRCCFHHDHQVSVYLFSETEDNAPASSNPCMDTRRDSVSVFAVTSLDNNGLACAAVTSFQGRRLNRLQKPPQPPSDTGSMEEDVVCQSQQNNNETQSIFSNGRLDMSSSKAQKDLILKRCLSEKGFNIAGAKFDDVKYGSFLDIDRKVNSSCPDLRSRSLEGGEYVTRGRSNTLVRPHVQSEFNERNHVPYVEHKFQEGRRMLDVRSSLCNLVKESWGSLHLSSLNDILSVSDLQDVRPKVNDESTECSSIVHNPPNRACEYTEKNTNVVLRLSQTPLEGEDRSPTPEIDSYFSKFELPKENSKQRIAKRQYSLPHVSFLARTASRPEKRSRYSMQCLSESLIRRNRMNSLPNDPTSTHSHEYHNLLSSASQPKRQKDQHCCLPEPKLAFSTPRVSLVSCPRSPRCNILSGGNIGAAKTDVLVTPTTLQNDILRVLNTSSTPSPSPLSRVKRIQFDFEECNPPVSPGNCHVDLFHPESFVYLGNGDASDSST